MENSIRYKVIALTLLIIININLVFSQASLNELKAAYISKFTQFVEWPFEKKADTTRKIFYIGYFVKDEFVTTMNEYFSQVKIKEKPVKFILIDSKDRLDMCDLIYLHPISIKRRNEILEEIVGEPILTISHYKKAMNEGVHINFFIENNHLRFEINPAAVKQSGLEMSYLLMKMAKIVGS